MRFLVVIATVTLGMALPPKTGGPAAPRLEAVTLQQKRWVAANIRKEKRHAVERIVTKINQNRARYEAVARKSGVPWYAIAGLHNMESSLSFKKHLHEGSPLTKRTRYIPKGRPKTGSPPFTWEESALDALKYDKMGSVAWDQLDDALRRVELYNGAGYLKYHKNVPSPYLWSFTTIYTRGKYVADGKWSSTAVSKQCGVAAIWKVLLEADPGDFPVQYSQFKLK